MNKDNQPAGAVYRPGLILTLICLPVFIGALDLTIISAVLPNVIVDLRLPFQTGADEAAWMVSGYLLAYTVSVAIMGRISDIIGRRRTYFVSLLIFILGSWLVATAMYVPADWVRRIVRMIEGGRPDQSYMALYALIAGRVIQALGAGAMVPVSMALVGDLYPPQQRAMAIGVVGAVDTAGWVLGHLYGGVMVQFVAWPVLFWINIPITAGIAYITWKQLSSTAKKHQEGGLTSPAVGVISAGVGALTLLSLLEFIRAVLPEDSMEWAASLLDIKWLTALLVLSMLGAIIMTLVESRRVEGSSRPNWIAALLLTVILVGLNIGLGGGSESDLTATLEKASPPFSVSDLVILGIAATGLIGYVWYERRSKYPLFNLSNFKDRNVSLTTLINLFVGFCLMVGLVSVPLFVNSIMAADLDEAALLSGILLGALTIPMALASIPGGWLTERVGYRIPTTAGMILAATGFYLASTWPSDVTRLTIALHMTLAGIGLGLTVAPIGTAMINAVDDHERGSASALVLIMRLIGMTLGTSIMTHYGLRRLDTLTTQALSEASETLDIFQMVIGITTQVINEMLLFAAIVSAIAIIPALVLRPRDKNKAAEV